MTARYFVLRLVRRGPLVPARLQSIDHEPGEPANKRDRWPPTILICDIAGEDTPPEDLTDRFHWPARHWKYAEPIGEGEYRHRLQWLRWAEKGRPDHPVLRPRRRIDPHTQPAPNFEREKAHVG
jgi:hypothetical protein